MRNRGQVPFTSVCPTDAGSGESRTATEVLAQCSCMPRSRRMSTRNSGFCGYFTHSDGTLSAFTEKVRCRAEDCVAARAAHASTGSSELCSTAGAVKSRVTERLSTASFCAIACSV